MKNSIFNSVKRYLRSEKGTAIPLMAIGIGAFVTALGVSTDYARQQVLQSKLAVSLDAAALNAAKYLDDEQQMINELKRYTEANFQDFERGVPLSFVIRRSENNTRLYVKAQARANPGFSGFFSRDEGMYVTAETAVTVNEHAAEIVLTLDNTGSMANEMADLKKAAKTFVQEFMKHNTGKKTVARVGLVPFSDSVNIGTVHSRFTENDFKDRGDADWNGCVEARADGDDVNDATPTAAPYVKFYNACNEENEWYGNNPTLHNNCTKGGDDFEYQKTLNADLGPNKHCINANIIPLTDNSEKIIAEIDRMEAYGTTQIPLGLSWTWNMLSPNWQSHWRISTPTQKLPSDYRQDTRKFVVLMTDGSNVYKSSRYSSYQNVLKNSPNSAERLDEKMSDLCTNMKNQGIIIYTVALGWDLNARTLELLKQCATSPDYAYKIGSSSELNLKFQSLVQEMSRSMQSLRLTGVKDSDR